MRKEEAMTSKNVKPVRAHKNPICICCKERKPVSGFYKDDSRGPGVMSRCKLCDIIRARVRYKKLRHTKNYKVRKLKSSLKWAKNNILKVKAHSMVSRA